MWDALIKRAREADFQVRIYFLIWMAVGVLGYYAEMVLGCYAKLASQMSNSLTGVPQMGQVFG